MLRLLFGEQDSSLFGDLGEVPFSPGGCSLDVVLRSKLACLPELILSSESSDALCSKFLVPGCQGSDSCFVMSVSGITTMVYYRLVWLRC